MTNYQLWTLAIRIVTLGLLLGLIIVVVPAMPVLVHAAQVYIRMYG